LLLHGATDSRLRMILRMRFLHARGHAVLAIDFQAHGMSEGRYITLGDRESDDARAAAAWLRDRLPAERIAAIGISLGGAAALVGAVPLDVDALAIESAFPDLFRTVRNRLRFFLGPLGERLTPLLIAIGAEATGADVNKLAPVEAIGRFAGPVFVLSGTRDPWTPIEETRELHARAKAPKRLWEVSGARHQDLYLYAPQEYRRRMGAFLDESLACTVRTRRSEPSRQSRLL
jgi:pimeloyl-ACP methyl ester carboxylesterase